MGEPRVSTEKIAWGRVQVVATNTTGAAPKYVQQLAQYALDAREYIARLEAVRGAAQAIWQPLSATGARAEDAVDAEFRRRHDALRAALDAVSVPREEPT
jgi:hypothetical protein